MKGKHHKSEEKSSNTFHVPRNLELSLETAPVSPLDLVHLRYYTEYQWLVDFSLYTGIVYTMSEVRDPEALIDESRCGTASSIRPRKQY